jgi:plastocyanin
MARAAGVGVVAVVALCTGAASMGAQSPAASSRAAGRIEGVATISSRITTPRLRVRVYDEAGAAAPGAATDEHRFSGVVLYSESDDRSGALRRAAPERAAGPPVLRQRGERFAPHVLPIVSGSTVEFPNDDDVFHNVFSLSRAKAFDLGRYPRGASKSVTFGNAGVVQVFCHLHADMSGIILVLDNPFFVVPDAQGRFAIEGLPPGDYRLVAYHERIKPLVTPVRVEAGRTTTLNLNIPLPEEPGRP